MTSLPSAVALVSPESLKFSPNRLAVNLETGIQRQIRQLWIHSAHKGVGISLFLGMKLCSAQRVCLSVCLCRFRMTSTFSRGL